MVLYTMILGLLLRLTDATGCNELIFHPLVQWWYKGPITKQLRVFLWSSAPVHYKISMMAYMFSYCEYPMIFPPFTTVSYLARCLQTGLQPPQYFLS